jgi:hypothetical protein
LGMEDIVTRVGGARPAGSFRLVSSIQTHGWSGFSYMSIECCSRACQSIAPANDYIVPPASEALPHMADSGTTSDRWPPIHFYRDSLISIVSFVVSAGSILGAVFLFTYCVPVTINGNSLCIYPHLLAATCFLLVGVLFSILGITYGILAWLSLEPDRYRQLLNYWNQKTGDWSEESSETAHRPVTDVSGPSRPP